MNETGSTFLEVVIAMLLVAIMASSVFTIALTSKRGSGRSMRQLVAGQASRQIAVALKDYVTGDSSATFITGPGGGANSWSLTNQNLNALDPKEQDICDDCGLGAGCANCYALQPGTHNISGFLPGWLESTYGGKIKYTVTYNQPGINAPAVNVEVTWDEP